MWACPNQTNSREASPRGRPNASALVRFDSSALAVLLECPREALHDGKGFGVRGLAPRLQALAQPQRHQGMQQDDGIATTGQTDRQQPIRGETGGEKGADPLREVS
mgnify:CR=1 FL=1